MSDELKIGVTSESNGRTGGFGKTTWHKIPKDSTTVFRVLPPLHSLAERGIYAKYHAVHYGFKNSKGHAMPFTCIEEKNKEKLITKHCPICDYVAEKEAQIKMLESQGKGGDQVKKFREENINPIRVSKRYYVNAIDANGEIGVLTLPIKAFQDLDRLRKEQKDKGLDITGIKGAYIAITRSGFGRDTIYRVALHQEEVEVNGESFARTKKHELTPEILKAMKAKTRDLATLFKTIDDESVASLMSATGVERTKLVDVIFSSGEEVVSNEQESGFNTTDLELGVEAVGRVSLEGGGVKLEKPFLEDVKRTETPLKSSSGKTVATTTTSDDDLESLLASRKSSSKTQTSAKAMTDEEFLKTFGKAK